MHWIANTYVKSGTMLKMADKKEANGLRKFGIDILGDVPWGTHVCQFYQIKQDLIDILVPYFEAGLENNEFCIWVTAEPLNSEEAKEAMKKSTPSFAEYLKRGQMEIISYEDWYTKDGGFNSDRVLQGWVSKLEAALAKGFSGLRLTGNTFWLEKSDWQAFADYEEAMNNVIGKYKMIAICTYSLDKCNANEIIDVVRNHQFAIIKRSGKWEPIESSERKKIADELVNTETKFTALYNSMTEGAALHDVVYDNSGKAVDYLITDVNPSYERITGLSKKQALGKKASELYGTGEPPYLNVFAQVASSGKPASFETYFPPMQKHFSISVFSPSKGKFTTVFHDITELKQTEQALQQAKRDWERTFDSVPDLIAILDKQHKIVRTNRAMAQRLGKAPEQCVGLSCYKCVHGTSVPPEFCPHAQTVRDGLEHVAEVYEDRLGGYFSVSTTPLRDEQGKIIGSVHVARDITQRKQIEQELGDTLEASQRRQAEVSALLDASKAVLQYQEFRKAARLIFDSCKELLGATAGYVALLSKDGSENEVLFLDSGGLPCKVDPSLPMPVRGLRAEAYHTGKVVYCNDFLGSDWINLMPEGHVVLKNVLFSPLTADKKTVGIIGLANKPSGFTERDAQMALAFGEIASVALINSRTLEALEENEKLLKAHSEQLENLVEERTKKLKDAERLATIGETAGMVGHDIRNPLQSIIGELYLARGGLDALPDGVPKMNLKETVATVEEQVGYINKIVTDLQDFAKSLKPCNEGIDLERIVQSVLQTMNIPENVEVTCFFERDFPKFNADSAYLKRILTNLFSNAVQAMPDGGKLTFNASSEHNLVIITVKDTGVGIPDEAKPKLFQPLFTTKSKGQGFGLAVCKRLVEAMGGTISFDSKEGEGTEFTIKLPR